jgi:quercetin dioxygenase-like cupin family protein
LERERLRSRESQYEQHLIDSSKRREVRLKADPVIRGDKLDWDHSRQAKLKFYIGSHNREDMAAPGWNCFIQDIQKHSGKHRHQGGTFLFVIGGSGYTVVDERRFDWEAGDLIILPVQRGGCVHQHFNDRDDVPAQWLYVTYSLAKTPLGSEITQIETGTDWEENLRTRARVGTPLVDQSQLSSPVLDVRSGSDNSDGTLLAGLLEQRDRERERLKTARMVIRGRDVSTELNQMGLVRWYSHPHMTDLGCRMMIVYTQELSPGGRSGRQLHQGSRLHYIWQGRGHTIIDGRRHDWQAGDVLLLPLKYDGVVHQHFNDNPREPAILICAEPNFYDMFGVDLGSGLEMLDACPEYYAAHAAPAAS